MKSESSSASNDSSPVAKKRKYQAYTTDEKKAAFEFILKNADLFHKKNFSGPVEGETDPPCSGNVTGKQKFHILQSHMKVKGYSRPEQSWKSFFHDKRDEVDKLFPSRGDGTEIHPGGQSGDPPWSTSTEELDLWRLQVKALKTPTTSPILTGTGQKINPQEKSEQPKKKKRLTQTELLQTMVSLQPPKPSSTTSESVKIAVSVELNRPLAQVVRQEYLADFTVASMENVYVFFTKLLGCRTPTVSQLAKLQNFETSIQEALQTFDAVVGSEIGGAMQAILEEYVRPFVQLTQTEQHHLPLDSSPGANESLSEEEDEAEVSHSPEEGDA